MKKSKNATLPDEARQAALRKAIKQIPFIDCGGFSITLVNAKWGTRHANVSSGWHTHPFFEFSLVRRGIIGYRTAKSDNRRGPGQVHFMYPDCQHIWDLIKTPWEIVTFELEFHANDPAFSSFIRELPGLIRRKGYSLTLSPDVLRRYAELDEEIRLNDAVTSHRLPLIVYDIFYRVVRLNFAEWLRAKAPATVPENRPFRLFLMAKAIIDENLERSLSPGEIASRLQLTPRYLNKLFMKAVRMPCARYIREYKLKLAYSMIASRPTAKIREVARVHGFEDALYFTRVFTRQFNISPTAIRENSQV